MELSTLSVEEAASPDAPPFPDEDNTDTHHSPAPTESEEEFSPALLFLEDFVVTALLSAGRPLKNGELAQKAEAGGWTLNRPALRQALAASKRLHNENREWEGAWRLQRRALPREERLRVPVEALVREFLEMVGKPLPVPVIAREVAAMRNAPDSNLKDAVATILQTAPYALKVGQGAFLHENFALKTGAPREEVTIRENRLHLDADFQGLIEFAQVEAKDAAGIARELMEFTGGPLSQRVIGFFVARAQGRAFSPAKLAEVLNDRAQFQPLLGGFVSLQEALPALRDSAVEFLSEVGGEAEAVDPEALLRLRVAPKDVVFPSEEALETLKEVGRNAQGEPIHTAKVVLDVWDVEPDEPTLVAQVQGLNEALRRDTQNWMPFGLGRFLLLDSVPASAREVPPRLKPATATGKNRITNELFDLEMDDAGLDGDGAAFVHSPEWDDIGEEGEVEGARLGALTAHVPILNHHYETGTLRIRAMDAAVWELKAPFSRLTLHQRTDDAGELPFEVWVSRENGLASGEELRGWFMENLGPSGGVAKIEREGDKLWIARDPFDPRVFLTENRVEDLEDLRAGAAFLSLTELLVKILGDSKTGLELPLLWAHANIVRRTSKRLLASVLSLYAPFTVKQRGQNAWVWTLDPTKDTEFKKGKRRFVRE